MEEKTINADNHLCKAYDSLTNDAKRFVRANILAACEISESHFYKWLKDPEIISKPNRRCIANAFHKEVTQLFPKQS